ncbi:MAG TPA: tyrosine-type recombinase/integrase [Kofleriaceae bacterium]|jgi:integrase|nr:tyrosine-type recombinase/integrase [Kofleriaceae bacterium]
MSALHDALTEYLAARRALGTRLKWPESSLRRFVDFVEAEGASFVTTDVALRWAAQPVGVQRATHAGRLRIVRGFAAWLQAKDQRTQVPPQRLLPTARRRPTPYIYSDREISDLIAATDRLRSASGLRRATFKTLLGLLAATGLRPGEALALDVADVDLVGGILSVRESKFGKSRFVPMDESARAATAAYAEFRDAVRPCRDTAAFLVTGRGSRLGQHATRRTFAMLCRTVGLRPCLGPRRIGRGPRLQDMRHTFATRRLVEWYRAGLDVDRLMPRLATYLGHGRVADTYWYIQAVPELLQLATERLERTARGDVR